jgi:hypothetical protein
MDLPPLTALSADCWDGSNHRISEEEDPGFEVFKWIFIGMVTDIICGGCFE